MQSRTWIDHRRSRHFPILEPARAWPGPGSPLQERVGATQEVARRGHPRTKGAYAFDLHLCDDADDVVGVFLDNWEEASVGERAEGTAEREVVGDFGDGNAEVGGYYTFLSPG